MMDTERTTAEVLSLLANNVTGAISPQDMRDVVASCLGGYAGLLLSIGGAPVAQAVTTTDQVVTVFNIASAQSSTTFANGCSANPGTGELTIGVTGFYNVHFFLSVSSDVNNKIVHLTPYINGNIGLVEVDRKFGTQNDVGVIAMSGVVPYTAGDVVDVRARVETGTANLNWEAASFYIHRVG
jgi:hypothetical protein